MWVTNGWVTIALALDLAAAVLAQDTLRLETGYFSGISCPTGLKVRVTEAVFGDTAGRSSCELPIQDVDTDYYARVMSECDGQQSCATLDVSVDGEMFCPGTIFVADSIVYVQITYTCQEAIFTVRREQGYFFNAICPTGHVVRVSEAVFGDTGGRSTCQLPVQDVDTAYYARVMSECDGQQSCATLDVPADGEMWCPGSFFSADSIDYVQITYTCEQVLTTTVRPTRTSPSPVVARILPDTGDVLGNAPEEDPGTPAAFVTEGATTSGLIAATELDEISVTGWEDWGTPAAETTEASIVVATVSQTDVPPLPLRATTEGIPTVVATAGSPAAVATDNPVVITEEHTYGFEVEVLTSAAASAPETATPEPCRRDDCSELDPITVAEPLATTGAAAAEVTTETTRPEIVTVAVDTTTAEDVVTVTQTAVIDTVVTTVPVDPCVTHAVIDARARHFTSALPSEESQQLCDNSLSGWVVFDLDGVKAEIPETCIKHETCGTVATFHLQLPDGQAMPVALSQSVEAHVCTAILVGRKVSDCCGVRTPVTVHRCEGFFVYKMTPLDNRTCPAAVCVKRPTEVIPYEYLADPPPTTTQPPEVTESSTATTEPATEPADKPACRTDHCHDLPTAGPSSISSATTEEVTESSTAPTEPAAEPADLSTERPSTIKEQLIKLPNLAYDELTAKQKSGIVTVVFKYPREAPDQEDLEKLDVIFRHLIASKICKIRGDNAEVCTANDVHYIQPTPSVADNVLKMSFVVGEIDAVDESKLMQAVQDLNDTGDLESKMALDLETFYPGRIRGPQPKTPPTEAHLGLLTIVIILIAVCVIIIIIGIVCILKHGRGETYRLPKVNERNKLLENWAPEAKAEAGAAETIAEGPMASNASNGQMLTFHGNDDHSDWVVPMDQVPDEHTV